MLRQLSVIAAVAAALCACSPPRPQRPPPMVGFMVVREQPVQLTAELPGRTDPFAVSNVEPQVTGIIQQRLFTEGSIVKAGQSLYQIDPRPYQAALDQAAGQLAQAQANLVNARLDLKRYQSLVGQNAISQVEVFKGAVPLTGLIMTKLDGTAKGGILVALADRFELPVPYIGVGEGEDDLQVFRASAFANALTGAS